MSITNIYLAAADRIVKEDLMRCSYRPNYIFGSIGHSLIYSLFIKEDE